MSLELSKVLSLNTENTSNPIITSSARFRQFLNPLAASTTENEKSDRPGVNTVQKNNPGTKSKRDGEDSRDLLDFILGTWKTWAGAYQDKFTVEWVDGDGIVFTTVVSKLTDSSELQTSGVFQSLRDGGGRREGVGAEPENTPKLSLSERLTKPSAGLRKHGIPLWGCGG